MYFAKRAIPKPAKRLRHPAAGPRSPISVFDIQKNAIYTLAAKATDVADCTALRARLPASPAVLEWAPADVAPPLPLSLCQPRARSVHACDIDRAAPAAPTATTASTAALTATLTATLTVVDITTTTTILSDTAVVDGDHLAPALFFFLSLSPPISPHLKLEL